MLSHTDGQTLAEFHGMCLKCIPPEKDNPVTICSLPFSLIEDLSRVKEADEAKTINILDCSTTSRYLQLSFMNECQKVS